MSQPPKGPSPFQPGDRSHQQPPAPPYRVQPGAPVPQGSGPAPQVSAPRGQSSGPKPSGPGIQPAGTGSEPSAQPPSPPISPQPQRDVEPRVPRFRGFPLPVSTTEALPDGPQEVVGPVFGVVTRPRDLAHSPELSFIHTQIRQDAIAAMVEQAQQIGADAIVGLRFDGGPITDTVWEITAYGTAMRRSR